LTTTLVLDQYNNKLVYKEVTETHYFKYRCVSFVPLSKSILLSASLLGSPCSGRVLGKGRCLSRARRIAEFSLEPLFGSIISEQKTLSYRDASASLNVLLGARLVLISHVHYCSGLGPIDLQAEKALEIFLNQGGHSAHSALLTWAVLSGNTLSLI
jgi:hypothetical protein